MIKPPRLSIKPPRSLQIDDPPTTPQLARLIDDLLNEDKRPRPHGFILLRFSHSLLSRPEYISTCNDEEMVRVLKLAIAQIEGRIEGEAGHA